MLRYFIATSDTIVSWLLKRLMTHHFPHGHQVRAGLLHGAAVLLQLLLLLARSPSPPAFHGTVVVVLAKLSNQVKYFIDCIESSQPTGQNTFYFI